MSLPALRAIRERFPEAHIAVLAKPWVSALYEAERAIALSVAAAPAGEDFSLVPLGIHNFYLHAVVQIDPSLN